MPSIDAQIEFINDHRGTLHMWIDMIGQEDITPTRKTIDDAKAELAMYHAIQGNLEAVKVNPLDSMNQPVKHYEITWEGILVGGCSAIILELAAIILYAL